MCSWSRPVATGEPGSPGGARDGGLSWGPSRHSIFPRLSGKEEALCRLQEENQRLSLEQERVSMADGGQTDRRAVGQMWEPAGWMVRAAGVSEQAVSPAPQHPQVAGKPWRVNGGGRGRGSGVPGPRGLTHLAPGPQLAEELEREQQSKQQLEGERRETESNWEAQIADILSWWVPGGWRGGAGPRQG